MTAHSVHPSIRENGLADGCLRCTEHALRPFDSLDDENLFNLLCRVVESKPSRSVTEESTMATIRLVQRQHSRLAYVIKKMRSS